VKKLYCFLFPLILLFGAYFFWSGSDRITSTKDIFPRYVIGNVEQFGKNSGKGNILALSPHVNTYNFSSQEAFYNMLQYHFRFAQKRNLLNDSTIVILPEYIGTWLVVANEKKSVYADTSLVDGMKTMVLSNLLKFAANYIHVNAADKTKETIFKMKAEKMLDIYQTTFSGLAKEFNVIIVAGSIVLPNPAVKMKKIEIDKKGNLYNISAVFDKNGNVLSPLTQKIFPIEEEKSFTCAANKNKIPVYKTTAGNLAVLICADAWYPENYEFMKDKNISVLAVPSFVSGNNTWNRKWKGYNGAPTPDDIVKTDINQITEHDAWLKYAMVGRTIKTEIKTGVNVFLRGDLWNLGTDGNTLAATTKYIKPFNIPAAFEAKNNTGKTGSIVNIWLE
jgi:predicted amidohydrolase